ncbi:prion-like-(Q N-rich) domain-bearing 25, partial [Brachionus plicatilis]
YVSIKIGVCETTQYFDGSKCTPRFLEFERCFFDDMCLLPMSCQSYLCTCGDLFYFENSTMTCLPKLKSGYFCDKNLHCRSDLGLGCLNNECSCDSSDHTWASQVEDCLLTYGKRFCHNDLNCNMNENLICQAQNCSCPQKSEIGMCDCNRTLGNEQFWNGKQCTIAGVYGRNCTNNFHCQTLTQKTECLFGICNCHDLAQFQILDWEHFFEQKNSKTKNKESIRLKIFVQLTSGFLVKKGKYVKNSIKKLLDT